MCPLGSAAIRGGVLLLRGKEGREGRRNGRKKGKGEKRTREKGKGRGLPPVYLTFCLWAWKQTNNK